jgi:hypothetical protein
MTRIGFAYNQKPDDEGAPHGGADADAPRADEEPPSTRRDALSRSPAPPHSPGTLGADGAAPSATLAVARSAHPTDLPDDEFAEWDSVETIDAVEQALAAFGTVIRLEANESFPERLRAARPAPTSSSTWPRGSRA